MPPQIVGYCLLLYIFLAIILVCVLESVYCRYHQCSLPSGARRFVLFLHHHNLGDFAVALETDNVKRIILVFLSYYANT